MFSLQECQTHLNVCDQNMSDTSQRFRSKKPVTSQHCLTPLDAKGPKNQSQPLTDLLMSEIQETSHNMSETS